MFSLISPDNSSNNLKRIIIIDRRTNYGLFFYESENTYMKIYYIPIALIGALIIFAIINKMSKNKSPLKRGFISILSGLSALFIVDALSVYTGVYLPVSVLSIIISSVLGIPGVTTMLCINLAF